VNQFESQQNMGYCGPATATIVLNTLRIDNPRVTKPRDESLFPAEFRKRLPPGLEPVFSRYTQSTFFDARTESVKPRDRFFGGAPAAGKKPSPGLQIRELHEIFKAHGLASDLRIVDDKVTDAMVREELSRNLATPGDYVVVNYLRAALQQRGGGHISPVGAYDQKSDSFLILDVNPTAQKWVWLPTSDLVKAMRTLDATENRGYLLVREGTL
jgi:hypothetical protein